MTTPGGPPWGPYGPPPQYGQQPPPYGAPQAPGRARRSRVWIVAGAAVLVVALVVVLAVVLSGRRGGLEQKAQGVQPSAAVKDKRRSGGPFLDPIPAQPVSLWTAQADDIVGGQSASVGFRSASENSVLLDGHDGADHSMFVLDAATGKKKWQAPAPFGESLMSCDLAEDSSAVCWSDTPADQPPPGGAPSETDFLDTVRLAFFGPDGSARKTIVLPPERWTRVYPQRDGFLVVQWGGTVDEPVALVTRFTGSGEQRWTAQGAPGLSKFELSSATGLFELHDPFSAQVYSADTGHVVGEYSNHGDSPTSSKNVQVALTATGYAVAIEKRVDIFDARGKKVNQIAGWSLPGVVLRPSSEQCGQIMLMNDSGVAAADAASGQILWQTPATGDASSNKMSCVGGYLLVQQQGAKTVDVYELDTGKKTGSIDMGLNPWSVAGTDGSVLLVFATSSGLATYTAYDLATGRLLWRSPRSENGQYLFCSVNGSLLPDGPPAGGGLYYATPGKGGAVTRLGQKR
ncbi:MAG: PQQ-binding-like beta-propeller repeat protein [Segniliparus sp.]|uniref:outer membrane protein assembly factor BamB family protein n=1 Tax=Segniliparus sp. TaxID=2804064 RepID=UPI003F38DE42